MTSQTEQAAGEALAAARRQEQLNAAPAGWPPADLPAAERIRDAATLAMGVPIAGYKIGATSQEAQRLLGCTEPFFGPLFARWIDDSGETLAFLPGTLGVECEFAFRIAADQPIGRGDYDAGSIAGLVASCHPALEIIGRRTRGDGLPGVREAVADFALNVGFVHGAAIDDWRGADLAAAEVKGRVDGVETNSGFGRSVLGHPLNSLAWLANALAARGRGLKAGDWVSTGTCLGVVPARPGTRVTGDFGALGAVELRFSG